jgi:hypothetical protein
VIEHLFDTGFMSLADRDHALGVLRSLDQRFRPVTLADRQVLPVIHPLRQLLPGEGLRRGTTIATDGDASVSLALALVAEATTTGSWAVAVGLPQLGLAAAAELGVALDRLALVPDVSRDTWPTVVAALVDAVDLVLVGPTTVRAADVRRVLARARERGAVLVPIGGGWPEPVDLTLTTSASRWHGLGAGHGHLRARRVRVDTSGRRDAARPRRADLWLPAPGGGVAPVDHPSTRIGPATSDHAGPSSRTGPPTPARTGPDTPTGTGARPVRLRPVG